MFETHGARLENVVITDGESALKHCSDIEVAGCKFYGKYPLWHIDGCAVSDSYFAPEARSAIWYTNHLSMRDCTIDGPKFFREMHDVSLERVVISDADETFWRINSLRLKDVTLRGGTYPFMFSQNIEVDNLDSDSKYVFQYCRNVVVRNSCIVTKDSFWECDNVTIYDSEIDGEYLAWHSKNVRLVRCHLSGEQLLCYVDGLVLEDCTFDDACDRVFEYSTVQADIRGHITNIKNPTSGRIVADSIGSVTLDKNIRKPADCQIITRNLK